LAKFPEPPATARLAAIPPTLRTVSAGTRLWRIYFGGGRHPTHWDTFRSFGPTGSRFDHHLPPPRSQSRAILYSALQGPTCLAEVFQTTRIIDRTTHDPWLVAFDLVQPVDLLDLSGTWPTRAGASMAINSGARPRARRWSRVIYDAYPQIDGLFYPSSMCANRPAVALYEGGQGALPITPAFHRPLADPALLSLLRRAARDLGYGLV
jgi:hypothetical protein